MICNTVPEDEKQNLKGAGGSWLHKMVRWEQVGRHSEGVSHVPACSWWWWRRQIVNTEA